MVKQEQLYVQCCLKRDVGHGRFEQQNAYIPEQFAETGRVLKIRNPSSGEMEDGWLVLDGKVEGDVARPVSYLIQADRAAKKTRDASDI